MDEWIPAAEAVPDGTVCRLRLRDPLGAYEATGEYFLHDDGHWYNIEPPMQVAARVTHFHPL